MTDEAISAKVYIRNGILILIVAVALVIFGVELHRHWADKTAEDVESLATLAMALLTVVLAYFNWRLARDTHDALGLAQNEFELSQQQFEQSKEQAVIAQKQYESEWRPDVRIAGYEHIERGGEFRVANLGRSAALVKRIRIRGDDKGNESQDAEYPLSFLVMAGQVWPDLSITGSLRMYGAQYYPEGGLQALNWQVGMSLALVCDCAGKMDITSEWFHCTVKF
jgi:hypothetical protein